MSMQLICWLSCGEPADPRKASHGDIGDRRYSDKLTTRYYHFIEEHNISSLNLVLIILHAHESSESTCCTALVTIFSPTVALHPDAGHDLLILEVSRSHTTTRHAR